VRVNVNAVKLISNYHKLRTVVFKASDWWYELHRNLHRNLHDFIKQFDSQSITCPWPLACLFVRQSEVGTVCEGLLRQSILFGLG